MKNLILKTLGLGTLALGLSSFSNAKVSDFNSLITDNISAQQELHGEIKKQMKDTDQAMKTSKGDSNSRRQAAVFMDLESDQINTPTSSKLLKYKKENSAKSVSGKKQMDRISQEFSDVE